MTPTITLPLATVQDMLHAAKVLNDIIGDKELGETEQTRRNYAVRLMNDADIRVKEEKSKL